MGDMTKKHMAQAKNVCKQLQLDNLSRAAEMTVWVSDNAS